MSEYCRTLPSQLGCGDVAAPLRGKMKIPDRLRMAAPVRLSRLQSFPSDSDFHNGPIGAHAFAMLLILLVFGHITLNAQQGMTNVIPNQNWAPNWTQNDPNTNSYPPSQQYAPDQQPAYGQPQQYGQQPYPQQPNLGPPNLGQDQQYPQQDLQSDYGQAPGPAPAPTQQLNTEQLEQLVAPIALYPDTLVAQILAAATYPAQVVDADHWRQAQAYAAPEQIVFGANAQNWDPSLKALTAFPQVLGEMDQNLRWTIALGNAYYNQPQDVLDVIQVMRQRAQAAGNLQSTPQESVSYDQGYIQVAPVNPQVVYLPAYNPWTAYGQPVTPYRGFSLISALGSFFNSSFGSGGLGGAAGSSAVRFGLGIAMSAFSHTSFGWLGWGLDWLSHALLFHNSNYYSHSTTVADWGLPHGGPRAFNARAAFAARLPSNAYRGPQTGYARPGGYSSAPQQAYARPQQAYVRPADRGVPSSRPAQDFYHSSPSYNSPGANYARPQVQAYNRAPEPIARLQQYNRSDNRAGPAYGSNFDSARGNVYGARPYSNYSTPSQTYRAPSQNFARGGSGERYSGSFAGRGYDGYSGRQEKSGSFHQPKAPKPPKMDKSFSRGHAEKGGHSGGRHHR
jgi:hypothetical protein